ncbi:hypothetical protein B484DRAFT_215191 [Ochromonadaceae sp. CCMP2298]|nr:hypothetical protein B484DRAFT_215191 [Ochromonadaceae sp. CCMP2298]|eukprot:CAMPEP_0173189994 /NCGR_PEP_ID=MMETSP1141-20130122/12106_1 /TAXON_ID=483371 /ORGANISM="non described non described, Strain CCMP2298" /LENGTH=160 /DNA_ID=CAMNT_0014114069 /DNA_START=21 /DNA_END=503 /DNA_ORIENTATION=-
MGLGELVTVEEEGATICYCEEHRLEHCHQCCCDYRDMNIEARSQAAAEAQAAQYAAGTHVQSGTLARIKTTAGIYIDELPLGTRRKLKAQRIETLRREGRTLPESQLWLTVLGFYAEGNPNEPDDDLRYLPSYTVKFDDSVNFCDIPCEDLDDDYEAQSE